MKRICMLMLLVCGFTLIVSGHGHNTRIFTIFTSAGCGCTGSGGAPETFTTHEEVMEDLRYACRGVDFIEFEGTVTRAYNEVAGNIQDYDGVLIIGRLDGDYRLAQNNRRSRNLDMAGRGHG